MPLLIVQFSAILIYTMFQNWYSIGIFGESILKHFPSSFLALMIVHQAWLTQLYPTFTPKYYHYLFCTFSIFDS